MVIDNGELAAIGADANEGISAGIVWAILNHQIQPCIVQFIIGFLNFCIIYFVN